MRPRGAGAVVEPDLDRLLSLCASFLREEGIPELWRRLGRFSLEEFADACRRELGYAVGRGNRGRMLRVLLDLASEVGWLGREGSGCHSCGLPLPGPCPEETEPDSGEVCFFRACLRAAPAYLRGGGPGIAFDSGSEALWDGFLASPLYGFARRWLLRNAAVSDGRGVCCLDLAYGTGQSTLALCRQFPAAVKVALDTHGRYAASAAGRTTRALTRRRGSTPVLWAPPCLWRSGFEGDLPFRPGTFDLVFFSCGDPYLPEGRRPGFYRDLHRVLRPGGKLAILTWGYPNARGPEAPSVRRRALLHDLAESVCLGWQGFLPAEELELCLREAGFLPARGKPFADLEGAAWVAEKPTTGEEG